jgi:hypothetical protein
MGRGKKSSNLIDPFGLSEGLMVLPVQQLPGGSKYKGGKKKKGKGKKGVKYGGDVQVNLVVDPTMFGSNAGGRGSEDEGDEESLGYGSNNKKTGGRGSRPPKRISVFEGLALEARWKAARKVLKWTMAFDLCCLLLWGIEFFLILLGKRCPAGQFAGWCVPFISHRA